MALSKEKIQELLNKNILTVNHKFQAPPICMSIEDEYDTIPIFSFGNISTIIAGPKVGKTTFIAIITASYLQNKQLLNFRPVSNENKKVVLWVDTEQAKSECVTILKLICRLLGNEEVHPANLIYLSLRGYDTDLIKQIIDFSFSFYQNIGFVIIDGIKDLVKSINDEREATEITRLLLEWSETKELHILNVLHQNKGDSNARGHLGTELINKSETIISLQREFQDNKRITVVEPKYTRHKEFTTFSYNLDTIPQIVEYNGTSENKTLKVGELTEVQLISITNEIFKDKKQLNYNDVRFGIKKSLLKLYDIKWGDNKCNDLLVKQLKGKYIHHNEVLKFYECNYPL